MKTLGRWLAGLIVLALVIGVVVYQQPLWVQRQSTHFGLFLARVQSNYVLTPEGRVHYYEAEPRISGGGIPLVLIHGLADRDESWAPMMRRLKRAGFHVYAPDLLGYGRSPKPAGSDYSIATQEQFVADFIQSLGLQKPNIGGWSMGGWVVLKLALDHPETVDRVIVYDSAGITFASPEAASGLFKLTDVASVDKLLAALEPEAKPLPPFVARDVVRQSAVNQAVVDQGLASMSTGRDILDQQLPHLTQPLLIVWGQNDGLLPLAMGVRMHRMVPTSELDIVEGCGHLAPTHCSPRVAAATADFLHANPAPQGGQRTLTNMH